MKKLPALCILFLMLAAALLLRFAGYDYAFQDRDAIMSPSAAQHWAGTDELGRDRAVRVAAALLIGLGGAAAAAAITTTIAAGVGLLAAYSIPWIAAALLFAADVLLAFPWLYLLMMVRSLLPLTTAPLAAAVTTFLILAVLGWGACARAIYRGAKELRAAEWMIQGRAGGLTTRQLAIFHVVPHLRPLFLPQFLICIPAFIVAEANLGALGLGVAEPLPSWGAMLLELENSALLARSHWVYLPIALLVVVLLLLESLTTEVEPNA